MEGFRKMNKELKDVQQAEQELFEELLSVILFLNNNGMRLDIVKSLIYIKVDEAFSAYEELDLRKRFKEDFEK
tara:strand:- start:266 stop:484 length:219 start_codon:yes stop_codon:yes gene_type:complete